MPFRPWDSCGDQAPCRGYFSPSTTVPLKPSPKSVVATREHHYPGRFHVAFKMIKRQMFGRASLPCCASASCSPPSDDRCQDFQGIGTRSRISRTRPLTRSPRRKGDGTRTSALTASAMTARATATAEGPSGASMLTTQMISSAVCALATLASPLEAARLAATANAAGSGWRRNQGLLPRRASTSVNLQISQVKRMKTAG